jgi:hypothetical protein
VLHVDPEDELFVFLRSGPAAGDVAVVALNFGVASARLRVDMPRDVATPKRLREALSGKSTPLATGRLDLTLGPWAIQIFVPAT